MQFQFRCPNVCSNRVKSTEHFLQFHNRPGKFNATRLARLSRFTEASIGNLLSVIVNDESGSFLFPHLTLYQAKRFESYPSVSHTFFLIGLSLAETSIAFSTSDS